MKLECKKCGGVDISVAHHMSKYDCGYGQRNDKGNEKEHLHYYCRKCSFSWTGKTRDGK